MYEKTLTPYIFVGIPLVIVSSSSPLIVKNNPSAAVYVGVDVDSGCWMKTSALPRTSTTDVIATC